MRIASTSLCCALLILLSAFYPKEPKKFIPPGTVPVSESLYFDQTEISNGNWQEFESWSLTTYGKTTAEYRNTLPDTLVWHDELSYNGPYVTYYYRHPAYKNFPVVGVTHEQAAAYCKWKTENVQQKVKGNEFRKEMLPKSFSYRLPSKQEWETAANAGPGEKQIAAMHSKKWGNFQFDNMISWSDRPDTMKAREPNLKADITAPVSTYFPNKLGIYNLKGNVAEIVSEEGIAKGGGWNHDRKEASVSKDYPYDSATAWLGFRCVCEVKW